ncbi:DUF6638 family protein [Litoreibacter roseus]|uniref:Uncharacterized protein n=1 Tax=Litoreibacter roseus TaxID=2601869 RepID=A0A6N6JGZ8_9RHOB|nr:DUF6638 family protein [Litoreibacter roseus]GFE65237.1 hypothetical protein KIN_23110 [Litoreibacter roseus]
MMRLIEKGLMYGNLYHVSSPALVARYNRALERLSGKQTALTDFHIDLSGYAPEIGVELDDPLYLNPNGCNRQFILLSTEQKTAPLLESKFSTSRGILRRFIEENEAQLFALTARDAVAGELVNSVYSVNSAADLFDMRRVTIEADTTGGHVAEAAKLSDMIEEFRTRDDAWWDDVLIAEMITLAKTTGDVTRAPIRLSKDSYDQENFWTAHFGGLYVFRSVDHPAAITVGPKEDLGELPINFTMSFSERNHIATFLAMNDLVEPIVKAKGINAAAILRQKLDFMIVDVAASAGINLTGLRRSDLRGLARRYAAELPEEFRVLNELLRWAEGGGPWPRIASGHPAYFYTLRAKPHKDRDLINMLLAELCPLDVRQLFICHKQLFYDSYATWPDEKKTYVADFLAREYQADKAGARAALFGADAPLSEPENEELGIVAQVGPWGRISISRDDGDDDEDDKRRRKGRKKKRRRDDD